MQPRSFQLTNRTTSPRLRQQLSLRELNRLARTVENQARFTAPMGYFQSFMVQQRNGQTFFEQTRNHHSFLASISSGSNPYAWDEVYVGVSGPTSPLLAYSDRRSGTTTNLPAYEINGNDALEANTIVRLHLGDDGTYYWFDHRNLTVTNATSSPTVSVANVTQINFTTNLTVTDEGSGEVTVSASGGGSVGDEYGRWVSYSKNHDDFDDASGSKTLTLATVGAGTFVHAALVRVTEAFSGGSLINYELRFGTSSDNSQFSDATFIDATATGDHEDLDREFLDLDATTDITATANSVGDTLDAATQGEVTFSLFLSELP